MRPDHPENVHVQFIRDTERGLEIRFSCNCTEEHRIANIEDGSMTHTQVRAILHYLGGNAPLVRDHLLHDPTLRHITFPDGLDLDEVTANYVAHLAEARERMKESGQFTLDANGRRALLEHEYEAMGLPKGAVLNEKGEVIFDLGTPEGVRGFNAHIVEKAREAEQAEHDKRTAQNREAVKSGKARVKGGGKAKAMIELEYFDDGRIKSTLMTRANGSQSRMYFDEQGGTWYVEELSAAKKVA